MGRAGPVRVAWYEYGMRARAARLGGILLLSLTALRCGGSAFDTAAGDASADSTGEGGGGSTSSSGSGTSSSGGDDATTSSSGASSGGSSGGSASSSGSSNGAGSSGSGSSGGVKDAGSDAKGTFACGPGLTCDAATEYCYHFESTVVLLDASANYSCMALPVCDAADPCTCMPPAGSIDICTCADNGGAVMRTCSCKLCATP